MARKVNTSLVPTTGYTATWGYGGSGHVRAFSINPSGGTPEYSPHWDGGTLLFVTDASGALLQINIEDLGVVVVKPSSNTPHLTVIDRDYGGQEVGIHANATTDFLSGNSGQWQWVVKPEHWVQSTAAFANGVNGPDVWPCFPQCGANGPSQLLTTAGIDLTVLFDSGRSDGYVMAGLSIQGVRAYDPGTQQWSTPDAYKGDVNDPQSQRSYMWNDNNPIAYSDPSGYEVTEGMAADAGGGEGTVTAETGATGEGIGTGDVSIRAASKSSAASQGRGLAKGVGQGIYRFAVKTENGLKLYIGKSINVARRLAQHILSGKLQPNQFSALQEFEWVGSRSSPPR